MSSTFLLRQQAECPHTVLASKDEWLAIANEIDELNAELKEADDSAHDELSKAAHRLQKLEADNIKLKRRAEFLEQLLTARDTESKKTEWTFDGQPVSFTGIQEKIAMGYVLRNGLVPPDDNQGTPVTYPEDLRLNDNMAQHPAFASGYRQELHRSRAASEKPMRDAFHKWVEKVTKRNDKNV